MMTGVNKIAKEELEHELQASIQRKLAKAAATRVMEKLEPRLQDRIKEVYDRQFSDMPDEQRSAYCSHDIAGIGEVLTNTVRGYVEQILSELFEDIARTLVEGLNIGTTSVKVDD